MNLSGTFKVKGYDQLDLIETKSTSRGFSYEPGEGYRLSKSDNFGIGIRAVVKGKVGHSFANRYEDVRSAVKSAIRAASYSSVSIELGRFGPYKRPESIYNKKLARLADETFLEQLNKLVELASQKKCSALSIGNSASEGHIRYINSEGVDVDEKSTGFGVSWQIEHKGNPCAYGVENTAFVKDVIKEFEMTCELAKLQSNKIDVKTKAMPIVLHHLVVPEMFVYGVIPSFSATFVQQGKSKLAGRVGEEVFSDKLSVIDDGLMPGGLGSGSFDGEGVPCQRTQLVEKGVVKGFLYDLARAKKDNVASTGNGAREYFSPADVSPTNFVVEKGRGDLVKEVDDGIMLFSALNLHSIDSVSGDFSLGACPAFIINKGELVGSPKKMMLSGNIYELLKKVTAVGSDQVALSAGLRTQSTVVAPSILSECLVIGE